MGVEHVIYDRELVVSGCVVVSVFKWLGSG